MGATGVEGRVVAITGGARGIGLATARALHAAGAKVVIGDLDGLATDAAGRGISAEVLGLPLDVTDEASFVAFIDSSETAFGALDVLINNAGIMPIGPLHEESSAIAQKIFEVNVLGVLRGTRLALNAMRPRGRGQIINVASVAGKSPVPGGASYAASKAAVISLTETARVEYRDSGISFTCVMPSFTKTDLILGTKGTKGIDTVTPEAVGEAITAAIARPVDDVFVPAMVGWIVRAQPLLGRRIRDRINRALGADRSFLEIDTAARATYSDRVAAEAAEIESLEDRSA